MCLYMLTLWIKLYTYLLLWYVSLCYNINLMTFSNSGFYTMFSLLSVFPSSVLYICLCKGWHQAFIIHHAIHANQFQHEEAWNMCIAKQLNIVLSLKHNLGNQFCVCVDWCYWWWWDEFGSLHISTSWPLWLIDAIDVEVHLAHPFMKGY